MQAGQRQKEKPWHKIMSEGVTCLSLFNLCNIPWSAAALSCRARLQLPKRSASGTVTQLYQHTSSSARLTFNAAYSSLFII